MRLIESKVELLPQPAGLEGVYKQIEIAGRTCYKSEDKITPDSAKEFVDRMIKNGHTAMDTGSITPLSIVTDSSSAIIGERNIVHRAVAKNNFFILPP